DASARYQQAEIAETVVASDADIALQVIDARDGVALGQIVLPVHELETAPLRAEQRFEHQWPVRGLAPYDCAGAVRRFHRPGGRRWNPRARKQEAGGRFVDAALVRDRVDHEQNADITQGMEDTE